MDNHRAHSPLAIHMTRMIHKMRIASALLALYSCGGQVAPCAAAIEGHLGKTSWGSVTITVRVLPRFKEPVACVGTSCPSQIQDNGNNSYDLKYSTVTDNVQTVLISPK